MKKTFLAEREGDILTSERGFVYAWPKGGFCGNQICTLAFFEANLERFIAAGWTIQKKHAPGQAETGSVRV